MFKLQIFLAFYTVGQALFGLAMLACIGWLIWICKREDGETLNPLKGTLKEEGEFSNLVKKPKTGSITTLLSNTQSQGMNSEVLNVFIQIEVDN